MFILFLLYKDIESAENDKIEGAFVVCSRTIAPNMSSDEEQLNMEVANILDKVEDGTNITCFSEHDNKTGGDTHFVLIRPTSHTLLDMAKKENFRIHLRHVLSSQISERQRDKLGKFKTNVNNTKW
jgi:hypothetical protein